MRHHFKKCLIAIIIMAFCHQIACAQISKNCDFSHLQYQYNDTTVNGTTYRTYYLDGFELSDSTGAPLLPYKTYSFSLPYNAVDVSIHSNVYLSQKSRLQNCTIMPALLPKAISDTVPSQIMPDSIIYSTNSFYPNDIVKITGDGFYMGENRILTVAVYPMQFNPVTRVRRLNHNISFTINYSLSNESTLNPIVRNDLPLRQKAWDEAKMIVDNPSQVESFAPSESDIHVIQSHYIPDSLLILQHDSVAFAWNDLYLGNAEYLIVTTRELAPSFRRLAALKRQKGYTVGITCIEDVFEDWNVRNGDRLKKGDGTYSYINDSAGKLRQFLRYSYSLNKTSYVLFGGRNLPFRYGYLTDLITDNQTIMDKNIPTDLYFSDLTTNWNIDGDNYYGENDIFRNERLDVSPELYVGRIMAENSSHVNNYTNKLLRYELNPGKGSNNYLKRVLITDGMKPNTFNGVTPFLAQEYNRIYADVTLIPSSSQPTAASIVNNINANKYGIINIFGHGCPHNINVNERKDSLSTGSYLRSLQSMANKPHESGLDMLDNKYYPGIVYSESCTNMPYDIYEDYNHNWVFNKLNLGQSFTLGKDYGGVAYLGNTRKGYVSVYNGNSSSQPKLEQLFINCLSEGNTRIGEAEAYSKSEFCKKIMNSSLYVMPHNLMGEPEFDIWTDQPIHYNSGINISRSNNSITVSGINADSTIVAICDNNGNSIRKYSVNGYATFTGVSPNSTIMLYKHNYLPYIAPMYIQNAIINNSQYVIAKDVYIGRDVDTNRTLGNVTIPSGVNYDMEFTGSINITGGFEVQKGAEFSVSLSDY